MNEFDIAGLVNGKVLPPLPPFPRSNEPAVDKGGSYNLGVIDDVVTDRVEVTQFGTPQVMPLRLKLHSQSDWWLLPVEPLITISGRNILVKRNVSKSKMRGSIKERWAQDDYQIQISGLFTKTDTFQYPVEDIKRLRAICEAREPVDVLSPCFENMDINRIVIESFDFPHTKGEENQNWSITAYSDDDWELLLEADKANKNVL